MSTENLKETLALLKEQGVTGPVEIGGVKFNIPLPVVAGDKEKPRRSPGETYDILLFGATEGIPDDEVEK